MVLIIRPATYEDGASVAEIYRPYVESSPATFEESPPSAAEMSARIESIIKLFPWLVCIDKSSEKEEVVGYAYASKHKERVAYRWAGLFFSDCILNCVQLMLPCMLVILAEMKALGLFFILIFCLFLRSLGFMLRWLVSFLEILSRQDCT